MLFLCTATLKLRLIMIFKYILATLNSGPADNWASLLRHRIMEVIRYADKRRTMLVLQMRRDGNATCFEYLHDVTKKELDEA